MGRKKIPGLVCRSGVWHIDKIIFGERLCESTGSSSLAEAETYLAKIIEDRRQTIVYGVRPKRTFREAATKYLLENTGKASLDDDARHLDQLDPYIGDLMLDQIHDGTLKAFKEARANKGVKTKSINLALGVVRRILNLAAHTWRDENGLTWLLQPAKITLDPVLDAREPHPPSLIEQARIFRELPVHLQRMVLFKVNSGCREQEVCGLRWAWERKIPELGISVFDIPRHSTKSRRPRTIVPNGIAQAIIDEMRGQHPEYVFSYNGRRLSIINNTGWQNARRRSGVEIRVHDLRHAFGMRLRDAGVAEWDVRDLLGHAGGSVTHHYSRAQVARLFEAVNKMCHEVCEIPEESEREIIATRAVTQKGLVPQNSRKLRDENQVIAISCVTT